MSALAGTKKKKTRKTGSALYAPVSFLVILAALVFGMSIFFRVAGIEVTGNEFYSDEEIIAASGIEEGDNLFFINRITAITRIRARLPYVESAAIRRTLPNRLEIEVSESSAIAWVNTDAGAWAIDRGCKLLGAISDTEAAALIEVAGLRAIAPQSGEFIAPGEAETPKVGYLADILRQISLLGMSGDVSTVDISDVSSPSFWYQGRFRVRLGSNENLEYKFRLLQSAVTKLKPGDSGTLDLSIDERAHLIQDY